MSSCPDKLVSFNFGAVILVLSNALLPLSVTGVVLLFSRTISWSICICISLCCCSTSHSRRAHSSMKIFTSSVRSVNSMPVLTAPSVFLGLSPFILVLYLRPDLVVIYTVLDNTLAVSLVKTSVYSNPTFDTKLC